MRSLPRLLLIIFGLILAGGIWLTAGPVNAHPLSDLNQTPSSERPPPLPTIYPPSQAGNGAQVYWGMCQDCHGDQGQGLTAEWRAGFAPEYRDCWASGCHGESRPDNSFLIPASGAPGLAGPGALPRFRTAFELGSYIQDAMPLSPSGSLTPDQAWELTAYLLSLNNADPPQIQLSGNNRAAIPIHGEVTLPESELPGGSAIGPGIISGGSWGWERPNPKIPLKNQIRTGKLLSSFAFPKDPCQTGFLQLYTGSRGVGGVFLPGFIDHRRPGNVLLYSDARKSG